MLKSSFYSDLYILINFFYVHTSYADARNKQVRRQNCALFTAFISQLNDKHINNTEYLHIVLLMYSLIEYSDNYAKASWSVWQYHKDMHNDNVPNSELLKLKARITGRTTKNAQKVNENNTTKSVEFRIWKNNQLEKIPNKVSSLDKNLKLITI